MQYHWIVTAVVPLVGVIGAGLLSYYAAINNIGRQTRVTQAAASYVDYLTAVANIKFAQTPHEKEVARAGFAAAKARIAIYGAHEVVAALAEFERKGADTAKNSDEFLQAAMEMRKHTWKEKQLGKDTQNPLSKDIKTLLLGPSS